MTIEACVESLAEAMKTEKNGATQIVLCADLANDGLTPDYDLIKEVKSKVKIPVKVMIRPRAGNFVYTIREIETMIHSIAFCKEIDVAGVVFGVLKADNTFDLDAIKELTSFASPLKVTIHKAIDLTPDLNMASTQLKGISGITSILSSGGAKTALEGSATLNKMIQIADNKIEIIAAGKITNENLEEVQRTIKTSAYHGRQIVGELGE
jgi:copper homeostasis protein